MTQTRFERARALRERGVAFAAVLSLGACALPKITLRPVGEGGAGDATEQDAPLDGVADVANDTEAAAPDTIVTDAPDASPVMDAADASPRDAFDTPDAIDAFDVPSVDAMEASASDAPTDVSPADAGPDAVADSGAPRACLTRNALCGGAMCVGPDYCGGCTALCCGADCGCRCAGAPTVLRSYRLQDTGAPGVASVVEDAAVGRDGSVVALVRVRRRLVVTPLTGPGTTLPDADLAARSMLVVHLPAGGSIRELFRMTPADSTSFDRSRAFVRIAPDGGLAVAWVVRGTVDLTGIGTRGVSGAPLAFVVRMTADGGSPVFTRLPYTTDYDGQQLFGLEVGPTGVASAGIQLQQTSFDGGEALVGLEVHSVDRAGSITTPHMTVTSDAPRFIQRGVLAVDAAGAVYLGGFPSADVNFASDLTPPFRLTGSRFGCVFLWKVGRDGESAGIVRLDTDGETVGPVSGIGVDGSGLVHVASRTSATVRVYDAMGAPHGSSAPDLSGGRTLRLKINLATASIVRDSYVGPFDSRVPVSLRVGYGGEEFWAGATSQSPSNFELVPGAAVGHLAAGDDPSETSGVVGSIDDDGSPRWLVSLTGPSRDEIEGATVGVGGQVAAWGVTQSGSPSLRTSDSAARPVTGTTAFLHVVRE